MYFILGAQARKACKPWQGTYLTQQECLLTASQIISWDQRALMTERLETKYIEAAEELHVLVL